MTHLTRESSLTLRSRGGLVARMLHLVGVARQRRALAELDSAALRDIGITRSEALAEARRAIWDAPSGWRR